MKMSEVENVGFVDVNDRDELNDVPAKMSSYRAVGLAEGFEQGTEVEVHDAWVYLITSGQAWSLQGWFGRRAIELLASGAVQVDEDQLPDYVRNGIRREQARIAMLRF